MRKLIIPLLLFLAALPALAQVQISASAGGGIQIGGNNSGGTPPGGSPGEVQYYCLTGGAIFCGDFTSTDGAGNIILHSVYGDNTTQGVDFLGEGTGAIPTPTPTNYAGWAGPASGTAAYVIQLPLVQPSGASLLNIAAPSTVNSLNQAVATFELISDFAKVGSNNTFTGTQTFNNVVIGGSCTGCGGGGSGNFVNIGSAVTFAMSGGGAGSFSGGVFTVGTAGTSITISAIPGTYLSLKLLMAAQSSASSPDGVDVQFNGDTGSNYDWAIVYGGNSSPTHSSANTVGHVVFGLVSDSETSHYGSQIDGTIVGYSATAFFKTFTANSFRDTSGSGAPDTANTSGTWRNTAAITSITLFPDTGPNFVAGTTIAIYGLN